MKDPDAFTATALESLFQNTPIGMAVWDTELRYVMVNPTLAAINGSPVEDHLGRHVSDVIPDLPYVHDALRTVLAAGKAITTDIYGRTPADPDTDRAWVASFFPLRVPDGRITNVGAAVIDVTDRRRAEAALRRSRDEHRFLAEASRLLASSLDLHATLESVADLAVPAMADWCAVDLVDDSGRSHNVALAHADVSRLAIARRLPPFRGDHAPSTPAVGRVIATGEYELHVDAGDELLREAAGSDEEVATWGELGIDSVLIVPMMARGRTIGAISFVTAESGRVFGQGEVVFAERLAAHCSLAVDNARLFGERTEAARQLQESLLPPGMPDLPGFELAARYRAAGQGLDVGGDFYDVFPIGAQEWLLAIGDVQGKGPRAAAVTGLARYTIRAAATRGADPAGVVRALNDALLREEVGRFLTLVYASLDLSGDEPRVCMANAGHPLPQLVRASGGVEAVGDHGLLLGVAPDPAVSQIAQPLAHGDALVLYTDGVIEAPDGGGEQFGEDGLRDLLEQQTGASAQAIADSILRAVMGESGITRDDVAILVLKRL